MKQIANCWCHFRMKIAHICHLQGASFGKHNLFISREDIHWDGKAKTKQIATVKMLTYLWLSGNGHPSFIQYGFFTISYAESAATELQCPICKSINILLPCILHILFVNVCTDFWNQIGNSFHSLNISYSKTVHFQHSKKKNHNEMSIKRQQS